MRRFRSLLKMKKAALLIAVLSTFATLISAQDISWDLRTTTLSKYTDLIVGLRNQLRATTCFQIPMMGAPPSPASYVLMKLIVSTTDNIFVAMNRSNSYVVGYSDSFNGKARAFLLNDAPANARTTVFAAANAANQIVNLNYGGSYPDLERNAGIERKNLGLTRVILQSTAASVFGMANSNATFKRNQGKFFLLVVQMVAEAARFKYMEGQFTAHLNDKVSFTSDQKMLTIVNQWGAISSAVAGASASGAFRNPITLTDPKGNAYTVAVVDGVRQDIGLLLYIQGQCAKP